MSEKIIVRPETPIDELVEKLPASVKYLSANGIRCIICGEPVWGTLESAAKEKGYGDEDIRRFVEELNRIDE